MSSLDRQQDGNSLGMFFYQMQIPQIIKQCPMNYYYEPNKANKFRGRPPRATLPSTARYTKNSDLKTKSFTRKCK